MNQTIPRLPHMLTAALVLCLCSCSAAPEQVTEFLNECVRPVLEAYRSEWEQAGGEEVTV